MESKKAIFYTPLNTEAKVQKVFADKMTGGVYPVEVELLSGPLKGTVAWVTVANVSPVAAARPKVDPAAQEKRKTDLQTTIEHRKNRRMKTAARAAASGPSTAMAPQPNQDQMRTQMQLQMLQQQAALAEAQLGNQSLLYQQMARTLRQQQLSQSYRNGGGVVFGPNGEMTMDEFCAAGAALQARAEAREPIVARPVPPFSTRSARPQRTHANPDHWWSDKNEFLLRRASRAGRRSISVTQFL